MTDTSASDPHLVQPWPQAAKMGGTTGPLIASGDGIYVFDGDGRRLIDGPAGMWCVNAGHRNAALIEADSIKTRFLANMSYEFRTPLTSIGGFAELLQAGLGGF